MNTVTAADLAAYAADSKDIDRVTVEVALDGICPYIAGAAIVALTFIISDLNGHGVTMTGDGTDNICGMAIRDADGALTESHCLLDFIPATD
jgi:hypothetical protein